MDADWEVAPAADAREVWFRVVDFRYAPPLDEWDRPVGYGESAVRVHEYPVIRHTKHGVWLEGCFDMGRRFVLRDARKRFACPTVEEAWESFRARKNRQLRLLTLQAEHVRRVLAMGVHDAG